MSIFAKEVVSVIKEVLQEKPNEGVFGYNTVPGIFEKKRIFPIIFLYNDSFGKNL